MQELPCPKCATIIPVRVETADDRGRVRLECDACSAKVLIKVNPRALKISPDIPQTEVATDDIPMITLSPEEMAVWAVVVHDVPDKKIGGARRALLTLPRFRANPNKLHDVTSSLPFIIPGLKRTEAAHLEEEFEKLGAGCETGPQSWLLGEDLKPIPLDDRGGLPRLDPAWTDEVATVDVAAADVEIAFDFGEARNGAESWLSDDAVEHLGDGSAEALDTTSSQPITSEALVEEYDAWAFEDDDLSRDDDLLSADPPGVSLPDTEEGRGSQGFLVVTVDALPGLRRILGGVSVQVTLASNVIGADADQAITEALAQGSRRLRQAAEALGAEAVVGLRTSQSAVPGASGWLWILVLSGTAVGR